MKVDDLIKKIKEYPKGFRFTLPYDKMTEKVRNDAHKVMQIAIDQELIECVSIGAGWDEDGTFNGYQNAIFVRR